MSGLVERVECLVAEERSILDMLEDFKKKKKYLLKEVKNEIKNNNIDQSWHQAKEKLEKIEIEVIVQERKSTRKCRYYNKGYCKLGTSCGFGHLDIDCKHHLAGEECRERGCQKRHRKLCRYWKSKSGCFRGSKCQFLHEELEETTTENYESQNDK